MLYFKHSELVAKYHISLKTVHNWIDSAKEGKLNLELHKIGNRTYIANTSTNNVVLRRLAAQGKKYRNTRSQKIVRPKPEFYELFEPRQALDLISNLVIHHELPRQYNYFGDGAENWDKFAQRMKKEDNINILKGTIELLHNSQPIIDQLLEVQPKVNVIDIGPGNGMPVRELLGHLLDQGRLNRYIAIDISKSMLELAEQNLKSWFGDKIKFEGYVKDINHERFDDLLVSDMLGKEDPKIINVALFLGATPMNLRSPYESIEVVANSLSQDDLLFITDIPDLNNKRRYYFDFNPSPGGGPALSKNHQMMLDLLGINESLYEVEMGYDEKERMRYIQIKLKMAVTVKFDSAEIQREVNLNKGDVILLLRVRHIPPHEVITKLQSMGLTLLHSSLTLDRQCILTIYGIESQSAYLD